MIITYLRSSSYLTHSMCPQKYFLEYCMGIRPPSSKKADKGNVVHKALEILARQKKCLQDGKKSYVDESFGKLKVSEIDLNRAVQLSFDYYKELSPYTEWTEYDFRECLKWANTAITINKGMFNPLNRKIIEAEQKFDFVIEHPWAHYKYNLNDENIEGQLSLKGTIDLIVEDTPGLIEIIDWKTGQRKDWSKSTGEKKTYKDLRYDPQLCLYHYAASRLFPKADEIFVTIVFINDGGPYTLCFDKSDLKFTEDIIRQKFEEIRDTTIPQLKIDWKCTRFCYFGMNRSPIDPTKTICQFYKDKVRKEGIENTMIEYGKEKAWEAYGSGGGRQ